MASTKAAKYVNANKTDMVPEPILKSLLKHSLNVKYSCSLQLIPEHPVKKKNKN
jgi:hypothetical protein